MVRYPGESDDNESALPAVVDEMGETHGLPTPLQPVQHVPRQEKEGR